MSEFIAALHDPTLPFLRYALLAGLLSSVAFGVIGAYVVTRRITYLAGAIAHCALGGIGVALYLQHAQHLSWLRPLHGAIAAALLAAFIIGLISLYAKEREDTAIGALWAIGMATGLLFIAKTPGYIDPMSYLFGNILILSRNDLWTLVVLDSTILGVSLFFYNKFVAICFDEEFARLRGVPVERYYLLLLLLTALTVVLMVNLVGIVMVVALLTLPTATAAHLTHRIWHMMVVATLFCMLFTTSGLGVSYTYDFPGGPTIILIGGAVYLFVAVFSRLQKTNLQ